jgi:hypothetical protein
LTSVPTTRPDLLASTAALTYAAAKRGTRQAWAYVMVTMMVSICGALGFRFADSQMFDLRRLVATAGGLLPLISAVVPLAAHGQLGAHLMDGLPAGIVVVRRLNLGPYAASSTLTEGQLPVVEATNQPSSPGATATNPDEDPGRYTVSSRPRSSGDRASVS